MLIAREAELAPHRVERDAGRRAEGLRDVLEAAGRAALAAEQAEGALDAARAAWTPASGGREGTALLARELRDEAAAARALLPEVDRAAAMRRDISRLGRRIETLDAAVREA